MLYTEDTYEVENQPYFGHRRGRYTVEEIRDMDSYAASKGIELMPCIQTLAHLNAIFHWSVYQKMRDCDDILICDDDNTYKLIDDMFASISKSYSTKTVNIGMDEAHMLGRGRYFDRHGAVDRFDILLKHLNKVSEIAKKYDFKLLMWGDMFFRLLGNDYYGNENIEIPDNVKRMIPNNVDLVYWDYYSRDKADYDKRIKAHSLVKDNIWFAGGLWTWTGFAPHNRFSIDATKAALDSCFEHNIENIFLTMWGDNGAECSKFAVLPSLFYASELVKGNRDLDLIKTKFKEKYAIGFDEFLNLDLPLTPNGSENIVNSEKYLLYNDCFMGLFDRNISPSDAENFGEMAKRLENIPQNEFSYLFDTASDLCRVLEKKCDLGIMTRKAYKENDTERLKKLITVYDEVISLTEKFHETFEKQWMIENKPHGFDVQDIRLGGLIKRMEHCKDRLVKYINGEIDKLEELEEEPLDIKNRGNCSHLEFNSWGSSATANIL
ncbi:MAG: family 20 glycosylhydrolase, partial [Clostridia bacterium]|nr:family 20 glycosylhydrolase [Clostridia bacterium]